jgi:hypothetical protein
MTRIALSPPPACRPLRAIASLFGRRQRRRRRDVRLLLQSRRRAARSPTRRSLSASSRPRGRLRLTKTPRRLIARWCQRVIRHRGSPPPLPADYQRQVAAELDCRSDPATPLREDADQKHRHKHRQLAANCFQSFWKTSQSR